MSLTLCNLEYRQLYQRQMILLSWLEVDPDGICRLSTFSCADFGRILGRNVFNYGEIY